MTTFVHPKIPFLSRDASKPPMSNCARRETNNRLIPIAAAQNLIEVEARFRLYPSTKEALMFRVGHCKQISFTDRYFCQQLALLDKWLRKRDQQWQLKIPVEVPPSAQRGTVVYKELVGNAALNHLDQHGLSINGMDAYANITTCRTVWTLNTKLPWGNYEMHITADECSADNGFKYDIGEIEILVNDNTQVDGASKAIEHICRQLKLDTVASCGGKLMRFLYEKNFGLYKKLEERGLVSSTIIG